MHGEPMVSCVFDEYSCNGGPLLHERTFVVGKICMGNLWVVVYLMSMDEKWGG
jgi:hypothetical protein